MFELFYDFLVDNEAQQGASLDTLKGLLGSAENATLFLLNGDVSYARQAPECRLVEMGLCRCPHQSLELAYVKNRQCYG